MEFRDFICSLFPVCNSCLGFVFIFKQKAYMHAWTLYFYFLLKRKDFIKTFGPISQTVCLLFHNSQMSNLPISKIFVCYLHLHKNPGSKKGLGVNCQNTSEHVIARLSRKGHEQWATAMIWISAPLWQARWLPVQPSPLAAFWRPG